MVAEIIRMNEKIFLADSDLSNYGIVTNLSLKSEALLKQQKSSWPLVSENFGALDKIKIKKFEKNNYFLKIQFNPSRITSSSAKVDKKSIENRACFLCDTNLPEVQRGINYNDRYIILCNPYPIFKQHLTIPRIDHVPQSINSAFNDMIELSYDLRDNFFVFYNGPKCGASAPDHLHFQAGLKGATPLEHFYYELLNDGQCIFQNGNTKVDIVIEELFKFINIRSSSSDEIKNVFNKILSQLKKLQNLDEEPLLNIIAFHEKDYWNIFVIPRSKHRPDQFFLDGESKLLISPASVDVAGLLITPREKDFNILSLTDLNDIFNQVLFKDDSLERLKEIF